MSRTLGGIIKSNEAGADKSHAIRGIHEYIVSRMLKYNDKYDDILDSCWSQNEVSEKTDELSKTFIKFEYKYFCSNKNKTIAEKNHITIPWDGVLLFTKEDDPSLDLLELSKQNIKRIKKKIYYKIKREAEWKNLAIYDDFWFIDQPLQEDDIIDIS